jgi:hypothetical protein
VCVCVCVCCNPTTAQLKSLNFSWLLNVSITIWNQRMCLSDGCAESLREASLGLVFPEAPKEKTLWPKSSLSEVTSAGR